MVKKQFMLLNRYLKRFARMRKIEIFLLIVILLLGISLRSPEILSRNFLFGFDQGRDYLAVREIVVEKNPTLIGPEVGAGFAGLGGIFHGPYYYYSLVPMFFLLDGHPYGGVVTMFLFGVASLFLCFYLTQEIFGTKAALLATFLLAVSPRISDQSRFMWNSHPTTFFILLAFWFTFKIFKNPTKYFFLATFIAGIIYGFELAISVPLIISQFLYVWLVLKERKMRVYLTGFLGALVAYLPFVLFELRHNFMATRSVLQIFLGFLEPGSINILSLLRQHLSSFEQNFEHTFLLEKWLSFLLLVFIVLATFCILKTERIKERKKFVIYLFLLPFFTFGFFLLLNNIVWDYYLIHLHLAYIFLFAYFFSRVKFPPLQLMLCLLILLMLPGVAKEIRRGFNDFYDEGGTAKIRNKMRAIDYIYDDAQGEDFNVLVFTPPIYDYAYRYLLQWYGGKKFGYVSGAEKKGIFYLWIEPEPSGVWHQGWLETVIKTGKVLKEETLPSGFIIQKRYAED